MKTVFMAMIVFMMVIVRSMSEEIGSWELVTQFGLFLNLIIIYKWEDIEWYISNYKKG